MRHYLIQSSYNLTNRYKRIAALSILIAGCCHASTGVDSSAKKPDVDVAKEVDKSYQFLKNREPAMKESEQALYERIVPMVFTKPDMAISLLERMLKDKEVESPAFDFALANVYFNAGHVKEAEAHYREAVQKYPEFLRAWVNLGILYYHEENYQSAIECLCKANSLGAPDAERLGIMAYCMRQQGNNIAAESAYMQAMTLDPKNSDWTTGLISIYLASEEWKRAENMLKYALTLQPDNVRYWKSYAWVLHSTGRNADAMGCLDVALSRGILDPEGFMQLGDLRRDLGLWHEAADAYGRACAGGQVLASQSLLNMTQCLIDDKRFDEAANAIDRLPAGLPDDITLKIKLLRSRLLLACSKPDAALEELLKAERLAPLDGSVQMLLGQTYEVLGKLDRAAIAYETATHQTDMRRQASLLLANLALKQKDYNASARYIRDAIAIQDDPQLREYLVQIQTLSEKSPVQTSQSSSPAIQQ